jgi:hypothetical protein
VTFLTPFQPLLAMGQDLRTLQLSSLSHCFDMQVISHVLLTHLPNNS